MDKTEKLSELYRRLHDMEHAIIMLKCDIKRIIDGNIEVVKVQNRAKKTREKKYVRSWYSRQKMSKAIKRYWATASEEKRIAHLAKIKQNREKRLGK